MMGSGFAETVMFRRVPLLDKLAKLDSLWESGIPAGYRAESGEYMVILKNGVHKTRTIRRVTCAGGGAQSFRRHRDQQGERIRLRKSDQEL